MGRIVEIGSLREPVEILDEPCPAPEERIGRLSTGSAAGGLLSPRWGAWPVSGQGTSWVE